MVPRNSIEVTEEKTARSLLRLLENLEDHDDVQKVHANFDIADELMDLIVLIGGFRACADAYFRH